MKPLRILHLRDTYEVGGPGKTILETYRAIDAKCFSLHLGVFLNAGENGDTPFVRAARQCGMPVYEIRGAHQYDPRLVWRVASLARDLGADIIHAHELKSDVIGRLAAVLHPLPAITTAHGWIANDAKSRVMVRLDKRALRYFDCVIAVSSSIRNSLIEARVPPRKIQLLHNAIVIDHYQSVESSGALRLAIGRQPVGPVLIAIGRLSPEKGHADLIEAAAAVAARGHRFELLFAGDGPERELLRAQVLARGLSDRVHFLGYVSAPERLLKDADLMVLPSHTEGLPNVVLESFALGVPVLATEVGGTPDVVQDGHTGRLVPAHAPAALARSIIDFLVDPAPWKRMAASGNALVHRRFNFETRTRRLEQIYREVSELRSGPPGPTDN